MSLSKLAATRGEDPAAKRERRKEARPGELLDAALDLFVEKGFLPVPVVCWVSGDGRWALGHSERADLAGPDTNNRTDVFLFDRHKLAGNR